MTPVRVLPPAVAYAAGLICEHRPDLADPIREAVLGDSAVDALTDLAKLALFAGGEGGADNETMSLCMSLLGVFWEIEGELHKLADILNVIPRRTSEMAIFTDDGEKHKGDPTIGDVWTVGAGYAVCGLGDAWASPGQAEDGAALLLRWLREGPEVRIPKPMLPGEREALRRLVSLHAHTVSLDPAVRAAWAKSYGVTL